MGYFNNTGYSCSAQDYILAMLRVNPDVDIRAHYINHRLGLGMSRNRKQLFTALNKKDPLEPNVNLYHCIPPRYRRPPGKTKHFGFCVFETINPPTEWIPQMNNMDEILTASQFNKSIFENHGVKRPVHVIPHCFDEKMFNKGVKACGRYNQTTFISVGAWKLRKNWENLIKSWYQAFELRNSVCLLIKTDKPQELKALVEHIKRTSEWRAKPTAPIYCEDEPICDFEDIPKILRKGDIYISVSLGEGFGLCFHPQTDILTASGIKPITQIQKGEYIFNSIGEETLVLNTTSRKINEDIIRIKIQGSELMVTEDHKILICDYKYKNKKKLRGFSWKPAKTLSKKDYLFLPKIKLNKIIPNFIDVTDLISCEYDNEHVWQKSGYSPHQNYSISYLSQELNCTKKQVENARKFVKKEISSCSKKVMEVVDFMHQHDIRLPIPQKYPRFIKIDDQFMNLAGWYIAEGSGDRVKIELSLGNGDDPHIPALIRYLKKLECKPKLTRTVNKRRIVCTGTICGIFPKLFGSGAHSKTIPDILFSGTKQILPLLRGYFLGDGSLEGKKCYRTRCSTVSMVLSNQIWMILNSLGIWSSCRKTTRVSEVYEIEIRGKFSQKLRCLLGFPLQNFIRKPCNHVFDINFGFVVPVKSITHEKYMGKVYDISVQSEDHAFVANRVVAHNSGLHAMALGIPVITTRFGGSLEYAKPDLCTYLEPKKYRNISVMDGIPQLSNCIWPHLTIDEISNKMRKVMYEIKDREEKAERAYKYVHENFTYQAIGTKFIEALEL